MQLFRDFVRLRIAFDVVVRGTGNNERRAGFVDEDIIHFVDDCVMKRALNLLFVWRETLVAMRGRLHMVAQIVEAEFVVRAVGDVADVGALALLGIHVAVDGANRQTEAHINRAHPFHIAAGEIAVHRDDVAAFAFKRVEICRQRRDERFSFTRRHFGDGAAVQDHSADELHVVMAQADKSPAGFAANRESFRHDVVDRLTGGEPFTETHRLLAQLFVGHPLVLRFQGVNGRDFRL